MSKFDFSAFFKPYDTVIKQYNQHSRFLFYWYIIPLLVAKNKPIYILETGSMHRDLPHLSEGGQGAFTLIMGDLIKNWTGGKLYTVDISKTHLDKCRETTKEFADVIEYVYSDSVSYINEIAGTIDFDLVYLDSYDLDLTNPLPSSEHHLNELKALYSHLKSDVIIGVDDNYGPGTDVEWYTYNKDGSVAHREVVQTRDKTVGKGAKIDPFLISRGWKRHVEFDYPSANNVYCYERN